MNSRGRRKRGLGKMQHGREPGLYSCFISVPGLHTLLYYLLNPTVVTRYELICQLVNIGFKKLYQYQSEKYFYQLFCRFLTDNEIWLFVTHCLKSCTCLAPVFVFRFLFFLFLSNIGTGLKKHVDPSFVAGFKCSL